MTCQYEQVRSTLTLWLTIRAAIAGTVGLALWGLGLPLWAAALGGILALPVLYPVAQLVEYLLVRQAADRPGATGSVWFEANDDDASRRRMRRYLDRTRDNPTIR